MNPNKIFSSKSNSPSPTGSTKSDSEPTVTGSPSPAWQSPGIRFATPTTTANYTPTAGFGANSEVFSIFGSSNLTTEAKSATSSPSLLFGTGGKPVTSASQVGFTPNSTTTTSAFGTFTSSSFGTFTSSPFGTFTSNPKTTASQIGYTPNLTTTSATCVFGTSTSSPATGTLFGAKPVTSQSGFTPNLTTTSATCVFGTPTSSPATGILFGAKPMTSASPIGFTPNLTTTSTTSASGTFTSSPFGTNPKTTASQSGFTPNLTTTSATSVFGKSTSSPPTGWPVYNPSPTTSTTSLFGTPIPSVAFGATPTPTIGPSAPASTVASAAASAAPGLNFFNPTGTATVTTQAWNAFHTLNTSSMSSGGQNFSRPRFRMARGTAHVKFIPIEMDDWDSKRGAYKARIICITALKEYLHKSLEELRWEDRQGGRDKYHKQLMVVEENDEFIKRGLEGPIVEWPDYNVFDVFNMSTSSPIGLESTLNNISENMDAMQKSLDKFRMDTDSKFCEAYGQQIEQYLAMKNITKLLMKIDTKISNEDNIDIDNSKLKEVLAKLENLEAKLGECQKDINSLKASNVSLRAQCLSQKEKIEQCEADIDHLKKTGHSLRFK